MDWFTADTHLGHANIIKHCNRPFANVAEMDEVILDGLNSAVAASDTLYHLGDFAFRGGLAAIAAYRARIRCRRIVLILGNHDPHTSAGLPKPALLDVFSEAYTMLRIRPMFGGRRRPIVLCHYAMRTWQSSCHGSWHLYGHSHGMLPPVGLSLDVGVDRHEFRPVGLARAAALLSAD